MAIKIFPWNLREDKKVKMSDQDSSKKSADQGGLIISDELRSEINNKIYQKINDYGRLGKSKVEEALAKENPNINDIRNEINNAKESCRSAIIADFTPHIINSINRAFQEYHKVNCEIEKVTNELYGQVPFVLNLGESGFIMKNPS